MSLIFKPEKHEYISTDGDSIDWLSVTSLISFFKSPFDAPVQAAKSAKNKKSKWYGLTVPEILLAWKNEAKRATDLGTWYHNQRERDLCELTTIVREGIELQVIRPREENGIKYAPDQKLNNGIYPEHLMYLKSAEICGQADGVEVIDNIVNIFDYKTNKELKTEAYTNWEGITSMMNSPVNNLPDCHISHYNLQLSIYMYMILKHNPKLKPGKLTVHHIVFEEAGRDKYDNPITALDNQGNPILKEIIYHELPYLKSEVISLINYLKTNKQNLKQNKHAA